MNLTREVITDLLQAIDPAFLYDGEGGMSDLLHEDSLGEFEELRAKWEMILEEHGY